MHLYMSCYNLQNLLQILKMLVIQFLLALKQTKNMLTLANSIRRKEKLKTI